VHNVVQNDWQKSVKETSMEVEIAVWSIHGIVNKDLNIHYLCQHLVP
jgi:hypothetical protein